MESLPAPNEASVPQPRDARYGPYSYDPNTDEPGTGLIEYWRMIPRRKGTVIVVAFIGTLLGFLITLPQTPVYQARTSLEIQDINQDFMNMKQTSPEAQTYSALTDIQTQIKILQSDTLRDRTVAKLKSAAGDAKPVESRLSAWRKALNLDNKQPVDAREQALGQTASSLKVRAAGQTRIIEVLADSTDPKLAADFANTIANEFIDENTEARWKMSQRTGDWLGRQLDDMRVTLEHSEDALQAYARQAGLVFTGGGDDDKGAKQNISDQKLQQIQQALSAASTDRVAKQSRYEMASTSSPEALPDVLNDSNLRDYQTKLTDLKRQLADLLATYTPEYSKIKRLQAEVDTLETALKRERAAIITRIKNEYNEALRREKLLEADYKNQSQVVTSQGEKSIQYNILKREVDSNRQLYEAMLQRVKESGIAAALKASNVRIVDVAAAPKKPYEPNVPMSAGIGLFAGGFLGVAFVVMRERADRTLQAPGDAPFWLNLPELGVIPSERAEGRRAFYYRTAKSLAAAETTEESMTALHKQMPDRTELAVLTRKSSMIAEAFRAVLTSVMFSGENGTRPRVIVLTSAGPGEGKSTVASNLAIALAEIGRRVLLIDADMRKPRVHTIFGLENQHGLSDILKCQSLDYDALSVTIQQTSVSGLYALPSGPATSAAANLLFVSHMQGLLNRFKREFDMVLIDTPPMLQMPDARVVGRMADAVLLVTRVGVTTRDAALAANQRLADDRIRIIGTVLNDWDPKRSPTTYYGYSAGYYRGRYQAYQDTAKS